MCYNVLCDKYATRQMYGYCPSWALTWEYRKKVKEKFNFNLHFNSFHIDFELEFLFFICCICCI